MGDTDEQLVELLRMLKPFVNTPEGQQTVVDILSKDKVAQERHVLFPVSLKPFSSTPSTQNGLSKLVSPDQSNTPQPTNVLPFQPGLPSFPPPAMAAQPPIQPPFHAPLQPQPYGIPPAPPSLPPPHLRGPQPPFPPGPPGQQPPGFAQGLGLSPEDQAMLLRALSMSQAELDMLPPPQRAIFMQLRSLAGR
ncbi:SubName: Full=Uncharacterized protein {ECO:0000313/EMBL:CCA67735.1} [Serendipita indica DSM 11827]|nr:SubName: Full=Uncharacterized protein {ECO:0000313/EMBL:CCA67735.1} [Serendipita indica DSM 11827]